MDKPRLSFRDFLAETGVAPPAQAAATSANLPQLVRAEEDEDGRWVVLRSPNGREFRIGPVIRIEADRTDPAQQRWVVTRNSEKGVAMKHLVWMPVEVAKSVVREIYSKRTKGVEDPWFHRGFKGSHYLFLTPDKLAAYMGAEKTLEWWQENLSWSRQAGQEPPPRVQVAYKIQKTYGPMVKGQFFSSSVQESEEHGGRVLSIQLPNEVAMKYLHQGAIGRGVGSSLLIPGEDLCKLKAKYPTQENDVATAIAKFDRMKPRGPLAPRV